MALWRTNNGYWWRSWKFSWGGGQLPVLFDESGAERVVGWYKNSDGLKKPVYERIVKGITSSGAGWGTENIDLSFLEFILSISSAIIGYYNGGIDSLALGCGTSVGNSSWVQITKSGVSLYSPAGTPYNSVPYFVTFQYTKTTDNFE